MGEGWEELAGARRDCGCKLYYVTLNTRRTNRIMRCVRQHRLWVNSVKNIIITNSCTWNDTNSISSIIMIIAVNIYSFWKKKGLWRDLFIYYFFKYHSVKLHIWIQMVQAECFSTCLVYYYRKNEWRCHRYIVSFQI